ncbi:MAG: hypothetical protein AAB545_00415 [Patescibacteria group bacterium]
MVKISSETKRRSIIGGTLSLLLLVLIFAEMSFTVTSRKKIILPPQVIFSSQALERLTLEAKAVFLYDFSTGKILYEKNAEAQLPLASLTKIMTAYVGKNELPKNTLVVIDQKALQTEGESGLGENERFKLDDLLRLILIESSNDGAAAVSGAFSERVEENTETFVEKMNREAQSLGLAQTYFLTETGLDRGEEVAGAYGSAHDVAFLLWRAYKKYPDIFGATEYSKLQISSFDLKVYEVINTNESLSSVPGTIASKTGFTDLADGNLALIFEAGPMHPIGVVVLGSSKEGRFTDATKLAQGVLQGFLSE